MREKRRRHERTRGVKIGQNRGHLVENAMEGEYLNPSLLAGWGRGGGV